MGKKYAGRNEMSGERRDEIRELLKKAAGDSSVSLRSEQDIFDLVRPEPKEYGAVLEILDQMESDGELIKNKKGRYMLPEACDLFAGVMRAHRRGFGFVFPDNGQPDVYIPRTEMKYAMDGDRVLIRLLPRRHGDHRTGSVRKILSRGTKFVCGTYSAGGNYGFVLPDDSHLPDIYVAWEDSLKASDGDKVRVRITKYPDQTSGVRGVVEEIFGSAGDGSAEIAAAMSRYEVSEDFPKDVQAEAAAVPQYVTQEKFRGRTDLRDLPLVTIDGVDARDFDDAVYAKKLEGGSYRLLVCIADVSEYVKEGSPLDREALARGCSVYFPNRVCPMLPKELSNGICSLNEGEDRLTLTADLEIGDDGRVNSCRIYESVIRSAARLVYADVSDILENDDAKLKAKYEHLLPVIFDMRDLAQILSNKRYGEGSIDFEVRESHITMDEEGGVISIEPEERRTANRMIEEFMLAANRAVAEQFFWMEIPFVYRVHEKPDQEKMEELRRFAGSMGLTLKLPRDGVHSGAIRDLLSQAKEKGNETIISRVALRSMKKAVYDTKCSGHFGLGFRYYCHFTSPIRRYPDLMIHRIIKETIHSSISGSRYDKLAKLTDEAAEISSLRERNSVDAERDVEKKLKAVYMSRFIGETFDGVVSGITSAGFFAELENTVEGYVPAESLTDDYYICDEANYRLVGEVTRRVFAIGQRVRVSVERVNTVAGEIDFRLIGSGGSGNKSESESGKESNSGSGKRSRNGSEARSGSRNRKGKGRRRVRSKGRNGRTRSADTAQGRFYAKLSRRSDFVESD